MHKAATTHLTSSDNRDIATEEIKLLVLDIDGTISGKSNTISTPVKQAIAAAQARGIQVAIATGRMICHRS